VPTNESPDATPADPDIDTGIELVYDDTAEYDPPHDVIVHNDDVTPFDFVVEVLRGIFELVWPDAYAVTLDAHAHGQAVVVTLPIEEAKYRVYHAHRVARQFGYPLTFSIRPI
jgi:ATP-dependent Clp protease adaptor protein ClpS